MALECLDILMKPFTLKNIEGLSADSIEKICAWQLNGGFTTGDEFHKLNNINKSKTKFYLYDCMDNYMEISVGGKDYVLVHAGISGFSPEKPLKSYGSQDFFWRSPDYAVILKIKS